MKSIGARLFLAFSCVIVFMVAQGWIAYQETNSLSRLQRQVMDQELDVERLRGGLDQARLTVFKLLGTMNPAEMDALTEAYTEEEGRLRPGLVSLGVDQDLVERNFSIYQEAIGLHYNFSVRTARRLINGPSKAAHEELARRLDQVLIEVRENNRRQVEEAQERAAYTYVGLLLAALAAAVLWALVLARTLTDRRRAEGALREREEHLRTLVESSPDGIVTTDHNRCIMSCNRAYSDMYGYDPAELLGGSAEMVHVDRAAYLEFGRLVYPQLEADGLWRGEWMFRRKDGSHMPVEVVMAVQRGSGNSVRGYVGIHRDMTKRRAAEERVRRERDRAQAYLDIAGVMFVALDTEGRITMLNRKALDTLGYQEDELLGAEWFATCLPVHEQPTVRAIFQEIIEGRLDMMEYAVSSVLTKDGHERTIAWHNAVFTDPQGRITGTLSSGEDITERKELEEELGQLFSLSPDPISIADIDNATFLKINPAFTATLGYSEEELLNRPFLDFLHPDDLEATQKVMEEERGGKRVLNFQNRYLHKNGSVVWLEWVAHPLPERGVSFAIAHDITARKKEEAAREQLEQQLRWSQKMEAVGTLAGGIAHDFNNILAAILGYAELGMDASKDGRPCPRELEQVIAASERARVLVRRILAFSHKAQGELRALDLNWEVERSVRLLERTIPRMVSIELRLAPGLGKVLGEDVQIEQLLLNLGSNANDAMPQGGRLTFTTEQVELDEEFCQGHPDLEPGAYAKLSVADTGEGIDQDTLEHVFEPFYTTKDVGSGTGLGLAMVYGIVRTHRGMVECASRPGEGTVFNVYLPLTDPAQAGPVADRRETPDLEGRGETILVVDDEPSILDISANLLEASGYRTLQASSGEQALELYQERGGEVDLVVLDISMPGIGGYRCLQNLQLINPQVKVIVASGYARDGQIQDSLDAGAADYVAKPYRGAEMLAAVRRVLHS